MKDVNNSGDGKFVVIQNGARVTAPTENQQEAQQEADRRNKLVETQTGAIPEKRRAEVKRNLLG